MKLAVPSVYDEDQNTIGSIEADGDRVLALDVDRRELGLYATSLEAVSAVLRAWRLPPSPPVERDADAELDAGVAAFMRAKP